MSPITNLIVSQYGGSVTVTEPVVVAKKGFTAKSLTFPAEGMTTTSDATFLTGFTPKANSQTQLLNLSRLAVDENSGTSAVVSIRPTNSFLYRQVEDDDSSALESLSTLDINASVRNEYVFTSTRLGVRGLRVTGTVLARITGARVASVTSGSLTVPTTLGGSASGTGASNSVMEAPSHGHWLVRTEIQALTTNYESFTLKAGSSVPDDDVFVTTVTGLPIKLSDMGLKDDAGKFLSDFVVNPTTHSIVKPFVTEDVRFNAGAEVPEGTRVHLSDYVAGVVNLSESGLRAALYAYGVYPQFTMKLSRGTVVENTFSVLDGFTLPGGQTLPAGSTTSDVSTDSLVISDIMASDSFQLMEGTELTGVVPIHGRVTEPAGMTSRLFQPLIAGMSTDSNLDLDDLIIPPTVALESEVTLKSDFSIIQSIVAAFGSIFRKGTTLYRGSNSIGGALINGSMVIDHGTSVTDRVDISSSFVVEPSTAGSNPLQVGAVLKGPFNFPVGTHFPSGNTLPAALKIVTSMGVTLAQGMLITAGSIFGTNGTLYGDVGFSPSFVIPALSTLYGQFNFPAGTKFLAGFVSGFALPVPNHFVFSSGTTLYAGTSFREGAGIPSLPDISAQAGAPHVPSGSAAGPLSKTADGAYLIIKAHTTFMPGFQFPVGAVLSRVATAGYTTALADAQGTGIDGADAGSGTIYVLAAASYSLDEGVHAPGQDEYTFTCGVPTTELVVMLADTTLPYDVLIPLADLDVDAGTFMSFNESLTLVSDIILSSPYTVSGSNNVTWPANIPLPADFTLTAAYGPNFTSSVTISKAINLNVQTTSDFVNGIMGSGSYLKFPPAGYTLEYPLKLGTAQTVSSSGSTATKAFVQLAAGTKLQLSGSPQYVTLAVRMAVPGNFTVASEFSDFPRFELHYGIILLSGMHTPGDIVIGNGSPMPANVPLPQDAVLVADAIVSENDYTLTPFSKLAGGSVLSRESTFPEGADLSDVTVSPILSLSSGNIPFINENEALTSSMKFPYLYDTESGRVPLLNLDARALLTEVASLKGQVAALEVALAGAPGSSGPQA